MYYLIPLPIIFLAAIVCVASTHFDLKILKIISKAIIVICVLFFIYEYLDYNNINVINIAINFFNNVKEFLGIR